MQVSNVSKISMDDPLVKDWLKCLRHHDAKQVRNKLEDRHNLGHRCCLGHLCHAAKATQKKNPDTVEYEYEQSISTQVLPVHLAERLDITVNGIFIEAIKIPLQFFYPYTDRRDGYVKIRGLTSLNDKTKYTLNQIADFIEDNIKTKNFEAYH